MEITVEGNENLALEDFDHRKHCGILLDGVADALILKKHRETLQGRAKAAKGGQSGTNMYAYGYTLSRRAVIVTMDLSAANLGALQTDHWLQSKDNIITLTLNDKAFLEPSPEEVPLPPLPLLGAARNPLTGSPATKKLR